ncbi:hypothetical protein HZS_6295 [Henneguya salminicola]|nr:hypothetical protein HZS_6295 [Henneguya salminicola]
MIRAFDSLEISHVEGEVDPIRDIEVINNELRLKDLEYVKSRLENMEKIITRANDRAKFYQVECMNKVLNMLKNNEWVRKSRDWNLKEIELLNEHLLITAKPVIYLVNIGENDFIRKKNKWLVKIKEWIDQNDPGSMLIPFSAEFEKNLSRMENEESEKYLKEKKIQSVMKKIIVSGFQILKLEYFFTAGKDEVKAWTIQKGTKAPQAAGKIHTDFEKGFIAAEVMKFEDFKELGSEAAAKAAGKYRQEGKQYIVQDGDIIFFKFNVTQQSKKK